MLDIPVLRWGQPYESLDKDEVVHFTTGETLATVSQGIPGLLAKDIRKVREIAGLPSALQLRDLRRTATIEEAENEATEKEIAAARGWSSKTSGKMLDVYGPSNFNMAKAAHDKRPMNLKGPKT